MSKKESKTPLYLGLGALGLAVAWTVGLFKFRSLLPGGTPPGSTPHT